MGNQNGFDSDEQEQYYLRIEQQKQEEQRQEQEYYEYLQSLETIAHDEKDAMREDMLRDEAYERRLRNDIDFFLEQNGFDKLQEDYNKLHKKMCDYGWVDDTKDFL